MSTCQDEKEWQPNFDENCLYSFPAFHAFDSGNSNGDRTSDEQRPPLVLELIPLPLLSENCEQMPVGARGWYASAILSAMMMLSFGGIDSRDSCSESRSDTSTDKNSCDGIKIIDDNNKNSNSGVMKGTDLLREDLKRACAGIDFPGTSTSTTINNNVLLELGSGTIGLAGMTMAWIVAQHECNSKKERFSSNNSRHTVMLTDYDYDCLEQLERNAVGVRRTFREYFSLIGSKDEGAVADDKDGISIHNGILPDIDVSHLDWNEYEQDQSRIFAPKGEIIDDDIHRYSISFACGAALVYTEDTAACVDQVVKILRFHSKAAVWVVQWPRGGWFSIFQQELLSAKYKSEDLQIQVRKFGPSSSPDMFSTQVQQLAQKLMPAAMQQESQMNIADLRAVRITNALS